MRNVQQTDSNISSDASPVIISSTVYRLHHMSTCSYINQDCFSSAGKKLFAPTCSERQPNRMKTGWADKWQHTLPCRYTLHAWRNGSTAHIINYYITGFPDVVLQSRNGNMECIRDISRPEFHNLFASYSYLFIHIRHARKLWCDTVTLPKPLSLFWACGGLLFWLLPQNQYPLCGGDVCLQQATILMGPSWYLRMWWFTTDKWHQMTSSSHLTRCLNIWLRPCFDRWLPLKHSIWSMDAQWNPIIAA